MTVLRSILALLIGSLALISGAFMILELSETSHEWLKRGAPSSLLFFVGATQIFAALLFALGKEKHAYLVLACVLVIYVRMH